MPQSQSARWQRSSYDQRKASKKVHKSIDVYDAVGIHYSRLGHENKRAAMNFLVAAEGAGPRLQSRDHHVIGLLEKLSIFRCLSFESLAHVHHCIPTVTFSYPMEVYFRGWEYQSGSKTLTIKDVRCVDIQMVKAQCDRRADDVNSWDVRKAFDNVRNR